MSDELKLNRSDIQELARGIATGIVQGLKGGVNPTGAKTPADNKTGHSKEYQIPLSGMQGFMANMQAQGQKIWANGAAGKAMSVSWLTNYSNMMTSTLEKPTFGGIMKGAGMNALASLAGSAAEDGLAGMAIGGLAGAAVGVASFIGGNVLGLGTIGRAAANYFNPKVYSAQVSGGDMGINAYLNGLYATALIVNCPTVEDVKKIDNWLTWYGKPTEEMGVPQIYTSGQYKVNGEVIDIKAKNRYGFMFIKTSGAVVRCPNGQAKAQFEQMLNQGTRFWSVDADRQETAA